MNRNALVSGFGVVSARERADADRFFQSLMGIRQPRIVTPALPVYPEVEYASQQYAAPEPPNPTEAAGDSPEDVTLVEAFRAPIDTAVVWPNGKTFFFKGDKYVRYTMSQPEGADSGYPRKIKGAWPGLWHLDIDAGVVWNPDTAYFFKGDEFIKYKIGDPEGAEAGYPKKIKGSWPGLWDSDLDAVMIWTDGMAYFFKGDEYMRYPVAVPIEKQRAEAPKKIRDKWPQVWDRDIDAAVVWNNGMAYFFKCTQYIGISTSGTAANPAWVIRDKWTGLIGAPANWRIARFPPRPSSARGGRVFFKALEKEIGLDPEKQPDVPDWVKRENAMVAELLAGNIPDFLMRWIDVELSVTLADGPEKGRTITGTVRVMPDYLAIGDDSDYIHAPLDPLSAQRVASAFGVLLPTGRICHAIYMKAGSGRLGMSARDYFLPDRARVTAKIGRAQDSTAAYIEHSEEIQKKIAASGIKPGTLVAGHKKDVVLSKQSRSDSNSVPYHGFYEKAGKDSSDWFPVEPCRHTQGGVLVPNCARDYAALGHTMPAAGHHMFSDYSQGVRFVHPVMNVDGKWMCVSKVLAHPVLNALICAGIDGSITSARIPRPTKNPGKGAADGY